MASFEYPFMLPARKAIQVDAFHLTNVVAVSSPEGPTDKLKALLQFTTARNIMVKMKVPQGYQDRIVVIRDDKCGENILPVGKNVFTKTISEFIDFVNEVEQLCLVYAQHGVRKPVEGFPTSTHQVLRDLSGKPGGRALLARKYAEWDSVKDTKLHSWKRGEDIGVSATTGVALKEDESDNAQAGNSGLSAQDKRLMAQVEGQEAHSVVRVVDPETTFGQFEYPPSPLGFTRPDAEGDCEMASPFHSSRFSSPDIEGDCRMRTPPPPSPRAVKRKRVQALHAAEQTRRRRRAVRKVQMRRSARSKRANLKTKTA